MASFNSTPDAHEIALCSEVMTLLFSWLPEGAPAEAETPRTTESVHETVHLLTPLYPLQGSYATALYCYGSDLDKVARTKIQLNHSKREDWLYKKKGSLYTSENACCNKADWQSSMDEVVGPCM